MLPGNPRDPGRRGLGESAAQFQRNLRNSAPFAAASYTLIGAIIVGFVRTLGITLFPEIELAVLYLIAAAVLLIRPTGLFGRA